jgi:hypothetical protein
VVEGYTYGKKRKRLWTARVWFPYDEDEQGYVTPARYKELEKEWKAKSGTTQQTGMPTRKAAAKWLVWKSLQIGVLREERFKLLHPLQQLAACAED